MKSFDVLVVGSQNRAYGKLTAEMIRRSFRGCSLVFMPDADQALRFIDRFSCQIAISEFWLTNNGYHGVALLKEIKQRCPTAQTVLISPDFSRELEEERIEDREILEAVGSIWPMPLPIERLKEKVSGLLQRNPPRLIDDLAYFAG